MSWSIYHCEWIKIYYLIHTYSCSAFNFVKSSLDKPCSSSNTCNTNSKIQCQWNLIKTRTVSDLTALSDTPRLQYYDVQTLEYRYISKLPMKNERIWSYVKETTSHLQNKLTKNIHLEVATSTRPPFSWKYKLNYLPL
jgi:hypothetical protein